MLRLMKFLKLILLIISKATFSVFITKSVYGKNQQNAISVLEKDTTDSGKDTLTMVDYYPEYIDTFELELKVCL